MALTSTNSPPNAPPAGCVSPAREQQILDAAVHVLCASLYPRYRARGLNQAAAVAETAASAAEMLGVDREVAERAAAAVPRPARR